MFCCYGFQNLIDSAGERGIAAVIQKKPNRLRFLLPSKGIDFADESKIKSNSDSHLEDNYRINISCTTGLQFCPFCGKKLQELIDLYSDEFEIIAQKHSKFISNV